MSPIGTRMKQIGDAVWFIIGTPSEYSNTVYASTSVSAATKAHLVRSVANMYAELFDRVCGRRGADPDSDLRDELRVDCAVYMIWDMDSIAYAIHSRDECRELEPEALGVLDAVLVRCRTSACRVSALHGIGHAILMDGSVDCEPIAGRLRGMIDAFLGKPDVPDWLREYALRAHDGAVQ